MPQDYRKSNGVIVYQGPSRIDGAPIVVVAVGLRRSSTNSKTGGMVQTYIIRSDIHPVEALGTGADASICGGCPHRPKVRYVDAQGRARYSERSCYVNVSQGPAAVFKAFQRGAYPVAPFNKLAELFAGRVVRLGSYGDPAAVPLMVWQAMTAQAEAWTGYTHQWKSAKLRDVTALCQASVDNVEEARKAQAMGLGYFRVRASHEPMMPGEVVCPASAEAGKVTTCEVCRMCDGASARPVTIIAHGIGAAHVERRKLSA